MSPSTVSGTNRGPSRVVTGPAVRVVVVDDHPLFRQGIGALIRDSPETELAGQGASGEEAVDLCAQRNRTWW